jgi:Spy/CpxP family protein refolding chaperone
MMPMMPGGQPMMPMMPMGQPMMPMMPGGQSMMPMMPGGQPMMPMMPMGQPMMPMMPMMPGGQSMMPMMPGGAPQSRPVQPMELLKLSDEQRAQLAAIGQETQVAIMTIMRDMYTQSGTLRGLFQAMPPDPASIGNAYGKMFDLQRQVIEKNVTAFNRYMGVLSDEQRAMWRNMRNQMLSGRAPMPQ